jgi:hypothetical protein
MHKEVPRKGEISRHYRIGEEVDMGGPQAELCEYFEQRPNQKGCGNLLWPD